MRLVHTQNGAPMLIVGKITEKSRVVWQLFRVYSTLHDLEQVLGERVELAWDK
jgi:hypothetical protein